MPNYGDLKNAILSYTSRAISTYQVNGVDNLLRAVNSAKDFAQREIDFRFSEVFAEVPNVTLQNGGSLADARLYGAGAAIKVRSVVQPYLNVQNVGAVPISVMSRRKWAKEQLRKYENANLTEQEVSSLAQKSPIVYVPVGQTFYIFPPDSSVVGQSGTFTVPMDVIQWIPDFTGDGNTHWLFDFCWDYMLMRSLHELNAFLKEDIRVPISKELLEATWRNVVAWNATVQGNFNDDNNLD